MNIAVISANGRSGSVFVKIALKAGHRVQAGVYGEHNFAPNDNLETVQCDGASLNDVKNLIAGCDVMVSLIGHTKNTPKDVQTKTIKNVITAVGDSGTKIISLTGTGVRVDGDKPSFIDKFLNFGIKFIDPDRIKDGINHTEVLKDSHVNWTIIRVLKLANGPAQEFRLLDHGPAQYFTSRLTVANAILKIINDNSFSKKLPVISPKR